MDKIIITLTREQFKILLDSLNRYTLEIGTKEANKVEDLIRVIESFDTGGGRSDHLAAVRDLDAIALECAGQIMNLIQLAPLGRIAQLKAQIQVCVRESLGVALGGTQG